MTQRQNSGRKKNTGIPYEIAVQRIFQEILYREQARTIKVEHNVQVQGRSVGHQIDVRWSFAVAGIEHLTIVQARDWNQTIKQEAVFAFRQILDDIPGQPRGVIVTRRGFQRGARKFANDHGIQLFILRQEPLPGITLPSSDFDLEIQFKMEGYHRPGGDQCWFLRGTLLRPEPHIKLTVKRLPEQFDMQQRSVALLAAQPLSTIQIFNGKKRPIGVLRDVLVPFVEMMKKNNLLTETFNKDFTKPAFLQAPDSMLFFRMESLQVKIDIIKEELPPVPMKPPGFVDFVLEDLGTGKKLFFAQPPVQKSRK